MQTKDFCHSPIIVTDEQEKLAIAILKLTVRPERQGDDVIDNDVIIYWVGRT